MNYRNVTLKSTLSAGLRAIMGAGYSRMNDLTIIQTTQVCVLL